MAFTLESKTEKAHLNSILTCTWGCKKPIETAKNTQKSSNNLVNGILHDNLEVSSENLDQNQSPNQYKANNNIDNHNIEENLSLHENLLNIPQQTLSSSNKTTEDCNSELLKSPETLVDFSCNQMDENASVLENGHTQTPEILETESDIISSQTTEYSSSQISNTQSSISQETTTTTSSQMTESSTYSENSNSQPTDSQWSTSDSKSPNQAYPDHLQNNVEGSFTPPYPPTSVKYQNGFADNIFDLNLNLSQLISSTYDRDSTRSIDNDLCDYIITGGLDNEIKIWNVDNKTNKLSLRSSLHRHHLGVLTVDVSNDGKYMVTSSMDANVIVWKTETAELISEARLNPIEFWKLKFSADNNFLITGSPCGKIFLYDVLSFEKAKVLDTRGKFTLSVAISPNNKRIASGAVDGIINIFDANAARLLHTLEGHAKAIRTMVFSPNSLYLLTGSDDGYMKIYDVHHANLLATVAGHSSWVTCVDITADGKIFASSSSDGTVKLWLFSSRRCLYTFRNHTDQVLSVKFAPDGKRLVSTSDDRCINIYSFKYEERKPKFLD